MLRQVLLRAGDLPPRDSQRIGQMTCDMIQILFAPALTRIHRSCGATKGIRTKTPQLTKWFNTARAKDHPARSRSQQNWSPTAAPVNPLSVAMWTNASACSVTCSTVFTNHSVSFKAANAPIWATRFIQMVSIFSNWPIKGAAPRHNQPAPQPCRTALKVIRNRRTRGSWMAICWRWSYGRKLDISLVNNQQCIAGQSDQSRSDMLAVDPAAHRVVRIGKINQFCPCFATFCNKSGQILCIIAIRELCAAHRQSPQRDN